MLSISIYVTNSDKYITRLRLNGDPDKKRLIRLNVTVSEYFNLVYNNRSILDQIRDGDYRIIDYDGLSNYISNNIYKIDGEEQNMGLREILNLLPIFQRKFVTNWKSIDKKLCFISTPIMLEKIKILFQKLYKNTEFVSFVKLQRKDKNKNQVSLIDITDYLPCIDVENNCVYDVESLLSKNTYIVRDDIVLIRLFN